MADLTTLLSKFLNDLYAGTLGVTMPITAVNTGDGTVSVPAYGFLSQPALGLWRAGSSVIGFTDAVGGNGGGWSATSGFVVSSARAFNWTSSSDGATGSIDTQLVRVAAGIVSPASNNSFGLAAALLTRTAPTVTSAGSSPSITASNGSASFRVNVGTGGVATTIVLAMPTAANGWNAHAENITATTANRADGRMVVQSSTATSLTLQYQTVSTGAAKAFTASDIVEVIAFAF